jgi:hypothetical protein
MRTLASVRRLPALICKYAILATVAIAPHDTLAQAPTQKFSTCLSIEDMTKERLDCFDKLSRPEVRTPAPKAKNILECRFLKEEDERLRCYTTFVTARTPNQQAGPAPTVKPAEVVAPVIAKPPVAAPAPAPAPAKPPIPPPVDLLPKPIAPPSPTVAAKPSPQSLPTPQSPSTAIPTSQVLPEAPKNDDGRLTWILYFVAAAILAVVVMAIRSKISRHPQERDIEVRQVTSRLARRAGTADNGPLIESEEIKILNKARKLYVDTKTDFFKRFSDAPVDDDLVKFREKLVDKFDPLIELILCEIAGSDGPINAREAEVLNVLLGQQRSASYYNELSSQPGTRDIDAAQVFGTVVDLAIQLGGIEQGSDYDAKSDPIVECFETLGQAILAADGDVNPTELRCLSKYTAIAHSKAADLDRRIRSVSESSSVDPSRPIDESKKSTTTDDAPTTIEKCVAELHALVGLASVKGEVETLTNLARIFSLRKKRGLPVPDVSFHMIFSGNPGTGKTTVARIVAKIYGCLGLLTRGQLVEVDRSGLVGGFVGQTATKTKKVIDQAKGGILFIDEAYSLAKESENDFGSEAIEVILKSMEDLRDDLVVIAAGYTDRMAKFLGSNPGLRSRFPKVIVFPDYSVEEMEEIFRRESGRSSYQIDDRAGPALRGALDSLWQKRGSDFANARDVRNLFERVVSMQADRVSRSTRITTKALTTITEADIQLAAI